MNVSEKIILCDWEPLPESKGIRISRVLDRTINIEGVDINRVQSAGNSELSLAPADGHVFSLLRGAADLSVSCENDELTIVAGTHLYLPPKSGAKFRFSEDSYAIHVAADASQSRGDRLLVHDERFLRAARFILTPQYLSRRAFLHRDQTLLSKNGDPIAWFHTTMFDTNGLPSNIDGEDVFKMSYDYQTEVDVVYEVVRGARVRFAKHPYSTPDNQKWSQWSKIDGETTYYLNESADGNSIERHISPNSGRESCFRNRHELFIQEEGHVSLCCMFDPGPTGLETHQPGEYSSYQPVADTLRDSHYQDFLKSVEPVDEMIRTLSLRIAQDTNADLTALPQWRVYLVSMEDCLSDQANMVLNEGKRRKTIIDPWRKSLRGD